jgi:hypothetical protein
MAGVFALRLRRPERLLVLVLLAGCADRPLPLPDDEVSRAFDLRPAFLDLGRAHDLSAVATDGGARDLSATTADAAMDLGGGDLAVPADAAPDASGDLATTGPAWRLSPSGTNKALQAVWGASPSDIWVVGYAFLHGTGSPITWSPAGVPRSILIGYSAWGSSASDLWVGSMLGANYYMGGMALHGTGHPIDTWSISSGLDPWGVYGIWGSSASDVWAVGNGGSLFHGTGTPLAWTTLASDGYGTALELSLTWPGCRQLFGVWGTASDNLWIVGSDETVFHLTGNPISWSISTSPATSHGSGCQAGNVDLIYNSDLRGVWGSSASDVWTVGHDGLILHGTGDPIAWSAVPSGATAHLTGVWGSSASDVWAVGLKGTILHGSGNPVTWSASPSGTTEDLYGVFGFSTEDVWAVGAHGTILHYSVPEAAGDLGASEPPYTCVPASNCGGASSSPCPLGAACCDDADCASAACDPLLSVCVADRCRDDRQDGLEGAVDCGDGICPGCAMGTPCVSDSNCAPYFCHAYFQYCVGNSCGDAKQDGLETDVDCGGGTCGPCLTGQRCGNNFDCQSGHTCVAGRCGTPLTCTNGSKDPSETYVDCGGACAGCTSGEGCLIDHDCLSNVCDSVTHTCADSGCGDGRLDGNEILADCGGGCAGCALGTPCRGDGDCASGACDGVSRTCVADGCHDHRQDGSESDLDCGGSCAACALGRGCVAAGDCAPNACDPLAHVCVLPRCTNGVLDGNESALDCGGSCAPCGPGRACQVDQDCGSKACDALSFTCVSAQCNDHRVEPMESDVDCGGPCPTKCSTGQHCFWDGDCASDSCVAANGRPPGPPLCQ